MANFAQKAREFCSFRHGFFYSCVTNIQSSDLNETEMPTLLFAMRFIVLPEKLWSIPRFLHFCCSPVSITHCNLRPHVCGVAVHGSKPSPIFQRKCQNCPFVTFDQRLMAAVCVPTEGRCAAEPLGPSPEPAARQEHGVRCLGTMPVHEGK